MTLTLYTNPMSRGRMVRWMLEELGVPYEARLVEFGPPMKAPDYLALNPMGKVPTLVHDGRVVTETMGILGYLAETFPAAGLWPDDRAGLWRWMAYGAGPVEQAVTAKALGWKVPQGRAGMVGFGSLDRVARTLADHIRARDWFVGDAFSVVDVYLGSQIAYGLRFGTLPSDPVLAAYAERLMSRPAALRAAEIDDRLIAERQAAHG